MTGPERRVPLLLAAGVLVVVVVAVVLLVGVERPPDLQPLETAPFEVPAAVAWIDDEAALRVAEPDGRVREVADDPLGGTGRWDGELLAWTDQGILVRDWSGGVERIVAIDPDTGSRSFVSGDTGSLTSEPYPVPGQTTVPLTERVDGRFTLRIHEDGDVGDMADEGDGGAGVGGPGPVIWRTEAPASYDVVTAATAPDGSVVALGDNAGRLLVVPVDGSADPRLWADGAPSYAPYVWEGAEPAGADR